MFKNKHVVIALIVAPILALISYFGVDRLVAEKPHAARADTSYPLAASPNCRYASGRCTLRNGDVKLDLVAHDLGSITPTLRLTSMLPANGVTIAIAAPSVSERPADDAPVAMRALGDDGTSWAVKLPLHVDDDHLIRLVLAHGSTQYYAQVSSVFLTAGSDRPTR